MTSHEEERDDLLVTSWYLVKGQLPHISYSLTMANNIIGGCIRTPCPDAFLQVQTLNQEPLVCWESRVHPSSSNAAHLIREVTTPWIITLLQHHDHPLLLVGPKQVWFWVVGSTNLPNPGMRTRTKPSINWSIASWYLSR